jgi:hypothetical protein
VYIQAHTLCQKLGDPPELGRVLFGLYRFHAGQGGVRAAAEVSQQLLAKAQRRSEMGGLLEGHLANGGAATSLSRLCQQQARRTEARQLLTDIYRWFTEGFDTADLKTAHALLLTLA